MTKTISTAPMAGIDGVLPFQVDGLDIRGRLVRLGPLLNDILSAHQYPAQAAQLLAQALTLTALIGSALKSEGSQMTLQARSDGPISLLVSDFTYPNKLRGYLAFDAERLQSIPSDARLETLCGQGYLALTLDQPATKEERYQAVVPLSGANLSEAAQHYFETSEQIPTVIKMGARFDGLGKNWIAGGLMLQHLPKGEVGQTRHFAADVSHPHWEHAQILANTTRFEELTDPMLAMETLLWRLFHESPPRVFAPLQLYKGCRCTRERIQARG
jgi:molecular chaperone Hsp33